MGNKTELRFLYLVLNSYYIRLVVLCSMRERYVKTTTTKLQTNKAGFDIACLVRRNSVCSENSLDSGELRDVLA